MFSNIYNFALRILFCTFNFHKAGHKIQAYKTLTIYSCDRCNSVFSVNKK
jgi:hypothetical protein